MVEKEVSVEELKKKIGTEAEPITFEIEKGLIRRFVEAVGDTNPLWQDEEHAKKTKYGGIIAPPFLLCAAMTLHPHPPEPKKVPLMVPGVLMPREHALDGGGEWEFFLPLKLGDTVTSCTRLANVFEREGKAGKMLFFVYETTYTNQRDEVIARSSSTLINY